MTRIGMISFEHMHGVSYANALLQIPNTELVGIYDADAEKGQKLAKQFNTKFFSDYEILLNESLDGVIICTNNKDHEKNNYSNSNGITHFGCLCTTRCRILHVFF